MLCTSMHCHADIEMPFKPGVHFEMSKTRKIYILTHFLLFPSFQAPACQLAHLELLELVPPALFASQTLEPAALSQPLQPEVGEINKH